MFIHRVLLAVFTIVVGLMVAPAAEACSCGGGPVSASSRVQASAAVFVGRVVSINRPAPISEAKGAGFSVALRHHPAQLRFLVTMALKSSIGTDVTLVSNDSCDFEGVEGQEYLVHALEIKGVLRAPKCSAAMIKPVVEAREDLKFLRNWRAGIPQAVVYGALLQRSVGRDGRPALVTPIVAEGANGRYMAAAPTSGEYMLVLAPGDYALWAESKGVPVSEVQRVSLIDGQDELRQLVVGSRR
jgi:hypothetical protein